MTHPAPERQDVQNVPLDRQDYRMLSDFRYVIRHFLKFSQDAAQDHGLTTRQHQALLAIKGFPGDNPPTIGELAERLAIQHHSTVELVDRLAEAQLILRTHDTEDRRRVLLGLTKAAEDHLARLSASHLEELHRLRPTLQRILDQVGKWSEGGDRVETDGAAGGD
ncbi:MarR family winged helix-turn-helix transcriptional regulator [Acidisphaera sp. S103]|uniref:MarR family winged helix-turn-helix transcriptional regulator n=1 Tax=Acidisphaera sp. S103 TaxID=1747223 RepID=UPI00131DC579|nr:MarR family transcriptional regulator [Acidisphaera sp. S103]